MLVLLSCSDGTVEGRKSKVKGQTSEVKVEVEGDTLSGDPSTLLRSAEDDSAVGDTVLYSAVPAHLDTALSYRGLTDGGNNRGPVIERFLGSVGLGPGQPWCAAFGSYTLQVAEWKTPDGLKVVSFPTVKSGLATNYITNRSIKASNVLMGIKEVPVGAFAVFRKGNGIYGHLATVKCWEGSGEGGITVEGNTSPGSSADVSSQRDGEGVYVKHRTIEPGNYFRIVSFTPVFYELQSDKATE